MAAGQGFKTFATGDVLTAADTNGYLMQGVWTFANAAARDAAVTSPQEGNVCYLKDTDAVQTYSGSAWVAVGGGAYTQLATGNLTGSSVSLTSISQSYQKLVVHLSGVYCSSAVEVRFTFNSNTGELYGYTFFNNGTLYAVGGSPTRYGGWGTATTAGNDNNNIVLEIPFYTASRTQTWIAYGNTGGYNGAGKSVFGQGGLNQAAAVSSIQLFPASGTFSGGTYTLYGVK